MRSMRAKREGGNEVRGKEGGEGRVKIAGRERKAEKMGMKIAGRERRTKDGVGDGGRGRMAGMKCGERKAEKKG